MLREEPKGKHHAFGQIDEPVKDILFILHRFLHLQQCAADQGQVAFLGVFLLVGDMDMAYLRPNYARAVCDLIKSLGGKPFVTDCNTLYVGGRKNALEHLDSAYQNGYNPFQTGVQTIIADGLKGTDEELVPINQKWVKEAKIGRAIM